MCGRFTLFSQLDEIEALLPSGTEIAFSHWQPTYNAIPSLSYPVYYNQEGGKMDLFHWGLIPPNSTDLKKALKLSNARSETAAVKPSFSHAFASKRALIPINGWFEWNPKGEQPHYHYSTDHEILMVAGLREYWKYPTGQQVPADQQETIKSFALLTRDPYGQIANIHNRMPVLMEEGSWQKWLNPDLKDTEVLNQIMADQPEFDISIHPVSPRMNGAEYDRPDCIEPSDLFF